MKALTLFLLIFASACASKGTVPYLEEKTVRDGVMKFCFLGDMGVGNELQGQVAKALDEEVCDSIHMLGDLIYPKGIRSVDDPDLEKRFLKYYLPLTRKGKGPTLNLILGNHDHQGNVEAWHELSRKEPSIHFPNPYYLQNWGGLCLVHLESNYFKLLTSFWSAQREISWLKSIREYLDNQCSTTMALTHHPYKSRGPHHFDAKGWMKDFQEEYVIGQFDYLISGHEHILSDEGMLNGTRMLISGAGGRSEPNEAAGFLVFEAQVSQGRIRKLEYHFRTINQKDLSSHQTSSSLKDSFE